VTPGRNVPVALSPRGDDDEPDLGHPTSNRGSEGGRVADVERGRTGGPTVAPGSCRSGPPDRSRRVAGGSETSAQPSGGVAEGVDRGERSGSSPTAVTGSSSLRSQSFRSRSACSWRCLSWGRDAASEPSCPCRQPSSPRGRDGRGRGGSWRMRLASCVGRVASGRVRCHTRSVTVDIEGTAHPCSAVPRTQI
jgi:hypothetical protein